MKKYEARLHANANSNDPRFLGNVEANSIKELKDKARDKARRSGECGIIHVEECNYGREFFVNA